ncbi:methyltransferase [Polyangium sp. 6x1]|uniref:methyltransferase n=1 Tax=Polyangium sp. 6x1 TaxID=3042689 RepID=UPI002482263D|nr:methyltransferase [Polyangium sp. 6x1]MDI1449987.1 methyltransferase [Polyangium sp. 6x1]
MNEQDLASRIEGMVTGYLPAFVLFAAVELGVFDALGETRTHDELARATGTTEDAVRRLCRVLASFGLVTIHGDKIEAVDAARAALASGGPRSLALVIRHHQRQVAPVFGQLAAAARTGKPQHAAWTFARAPVAEAAYTELARHPAEYRSFLAAMDHASRGVGEALVPLVRSFGIRRLVDLGCGGGQVARELLSSIPELCVQSFDLVPAVEIARSQSIEAGLGDRHEVRAGDLLEGVDARGADAVLLSAVLADWSEDERARILAGALRTLRPGGYVFISETLLDDDGAGPTSAAILSLVMLVAMRGDQLTGEQLRGELLRAGFVEAEVMRGSPRDLVVARAP